MINIINNNILCQIESCFLRTPDCVGGHGKLIVKYHLNKCFIYLHASFHHYNCIGKSIWLCENHEFTCFKPGRNEGEYCVW